jgi:hypothetical protein
MISAEPLFVLNTLDAPEDTEDETRVILPARSQ